MLPARALARTVVRDEGRRGRRRLRASRADGRHQPPFHGRLPRHHLGEQPAGGDARQQHLLGQPARDRSTARHVAPRARHERSGAARDRQLAGRRRQRLPARGRLRHHRGIGSDGDLLSRVRRERSAPAAGQHHRRLHARQETGAGLRPEGPGRHDGAAERRAGAQPGADARRDAGVHSWRTIREHRARLQLGAGHHDGLEAGRLRGDGSGLRRRPRRREVSRHQVPEGGARAGLRGAGGHHPRAQDARRREEGRSQEGRPGRARRPA